MHCAVIADDLTGACDSAVQFRLRGARSIAHIDFTAETDGQAEVEAFTTDTRDVDQAELEARICQVAQQASALSPKLIFKKIDSLLRGSPGREIFAAIDAFGCDAAVITPAYPELGRTVWDGQLYVDGNGAWKPIAVAELLREQGLAECAAVKPECIGEALHDGARFISVDATCAEDLDRLVSEALTDGRRLLWAGAGGLASSLAQAVFGAPAEPRQPAPLALPVFFCIGSNHPVTKAQLARLQNGGRNHPILSVSQDAGTYESLRFSLRELDTKASALVLSGGASASTVCRALEATEIELEGQIVPGVPWGRLRGGLLDGILVATKSGAFGSEDTLVRVADFFRCPQN